MLGTVAYRGARFLASWSVRLETRTYPATNQLGYHTVRLPLCVLGSNLTTFKNLIPYAALRVSEPQMFEKQIVIDGKGHLLG